MLARYNAAMDGVDNIITELSSQEIENSEHLLTQLGGLGTVLLYVLRESVIDYSAQCPSATSHLLSVSNTIYSTIDAISKLCSELAVLLEKKDEKCSINKFNLKSALLAIEQYINDVLKEIYSDKPRVNFVEYTPPPPPKTFVLEIVKEDVIAIKKTSALSADIKKMAEVKGLPISGLFSRQRRGAEPIISEKKLTPYYFVISELEQSEYREKSRPIQKYYLYLSTQVNSWSDKLKHIVDDAVFGVTIAELYQSIPIEPIQNFQQLVDDTLGMISDLSSDRLPDHLRDVTKSIDGYYQAVLDKKITEKEAFLALYGLLEGKNKTKPIEDLEKILDNHKDFYVTSSAFKKTRGLICGA